MTDNVTIRMGADATQAIREIARVKKAAGGLKQAWGSFRFGLGIASGFGLGNIMAQVSEQFREGFKAAAKTSDSFTFALEAATTALYSFGYALGKSVTGKAFEFAFDTAMRGLGMPPIATMAELLKYTRQNEGESRLLTGPQYTSPASDQFADARLKAEEKQVEYQRRMTESLEEMNRDMKKTQLLDPW
jgi:hypothetical protein